MYNTIELRPQDLIKRSSHRGAQKWLQWLHEGNFFVDLPESSTEQQIMAIRSLSIQMKTIQDLEKQRNSIKKSNIFHVKGIHPRIIWAALLTFAVSWMLSNYLFALSLCAFLSLPVGLGGIFYVGFQDRKREQKRTILQQEIDACYTNLITTLERLAVSNFVFGWEQHLLFCLPLRDKILAKPDDRINPHSHSKRQNLLSKLQVQLVTFQGSPPDGLVFFDVEP